MNVLYPEFVQSIKNDNYDEIIERFDGNTIDLFHGGMGVTGEAGELMDAIKKHVMYGKPLDVDNIIEEAGDLLYYLEVTLASVGSSLDDAVQKNIDKLSKRYHTGSYSNEQAVERADKNED